jgi:hypothetical protein
MVLSACSMPAPAADPAPAAPTPGAPTPGSTTGSAGPAGSELQAADADLTPGAWTALGPGVDLAVFETQVPRQLGDGRVRVVRVDPTRAQVVLDSGDFQPAPEWGTQLSAIAVLNAGMFHADGSGVFYLRHAGATSQNAWHPQASSALVVDHQGARLVSTRCGAARPGPEALAVAQSYTLLGCEGEPSWSPGTKIWSHAVLGMDSAGRILLIHARTPWHTRQFTQILLDLPLHLTALQYAEGGPEASLWVAGPAHPRLWVGSYETGFTEHDKNEKAWPIPAVIAIKLRP